jgi:hypothetical protein
MEVSHIIFHGNPPSARRAHTCIRTDMTTLLVAFLRSCDRASWHVTVHRNKFLFNKTNRRTNFPNLFCQETLHISGSSCVHHQEFSTVHSALVYVMQVWWHIPIPNVQWRTPDDGQRNWSKHVEFYFTLNILNNEKINWVDHFLHAEGKSEIHNFYPKN